MLLDYPYSTMERSIGYIRWLTLLIRLKCKLVAWCGSYQASKYCGLVADILAMRRHPLNMEAVMYFTVTITITITMIISALRILWTSQFYRWYRCPWYWSI